MTNSQKLLQRLRALEGLPPIPENANIERIRAGRWQRKAGSWSWFILADNFYADIGSPLTVTELLKAKSLVVRGPSKWSVGYEIGKDK